MSKEIRKQIDDLYAELEEVSIPDSFILNPKIVIVSKKIEALQKQCTCWNLSLVLGRNQRL